MDEASPYGTSPRRIRQGLTSRTRGKSKAKTKPKSNATSKLARDLVTARYDLVHQDLRAHFGKPPKKPKPVSVLAGVFSFRADRLPDLTDEDGPRSRTSWVSGFQTIDEWTSTRRDA